MSWLAQSPLASGLSRTLSTSSVYAPQDLSLLASVISPWSPSAQTVEPLWSSASASPSQPFIIEIPHGPRPSTSDHINVRAPGHDWSLLAPAPPDTIWPQHPDSLVTSSTPPVTNSHSPLGNRPRSTSRRVPEVVESGDQVYTAATLFNEPWPGRTPDSNAHSFHNSAHNSQEHEFGLDDSAYPLVHIPPESYRRFTDDIDTLPLYSTVQDTRDCLPAPAVTAAPTGGPQPSEPWHTQPSPSPANTFPRQLGEGYRGDFASGHHAPGVYSPDHNSGVGYSDASNARPPSRPTWVIHDEASRGLVGDPVPLATVAAPATIPTSDPPPYTLFVDDHTQLQTAGKSRSMTNTIMSKIGRLWKSRNPDAQSKNSNSLSTWRPTRFWNKATTTPFLASTRSSVSSAISGFFGGIRRKAESMIRPTETAKSFARHITRIRNSPQPHELRRIVGDTERPASTWLGDQLERYDQLQRLNESY